MKLLTGEVLIVHGSIMFGIYFILENEIPDAITISWPYSLKVARQKLSRRHLMIIAIYFYCIPKGKLLSCAAALAAKPDLPSHFLHIF